MADKIYKVNQQKRQQLHFIYGGLIGIGIVCIIGLLIQTPLDDPLTVSLFCFSIGLPFLALLFMGTYIETTYEYTVQPTYMSISIIVGVVGIVAGLIAVIWHFSWIAGSVSMLCCLWGVIGYFFFQTALKKVNAKEV